MNEAVWYRIESSAWARAYMAVWAGDTFQVLMRDDEDKVLVRHFGSAAAAALQARDRAYANGHGGESGLTVDDLPVTVAAALSARRDAELAFIASQQ